MPFLLALRSTAARWPSAQVARPSEQVALLRSFGGTEARRDAADGCRSQFPIPDDGIRPLLREASWPEHDDLEGDDSETDSSYEEEDGFLDGDSLENTNMVTEERTSALPPEVIPEQRTALYKTM